MYAPKLLIFKLKSFYINAKNIKTIQEHSVSVICLSYENEKAPQIYNKTWNV